MVIKLINTLNIWKKNGVMEFDKLIHDKSRKMTPEEIEKFENMNNFVNLSHKHKIILWLWSKCGTTHMTKIMKNFDFKFYKIRGNDLILSEKNLVQIHFCNLFNRHQDYKIVSAVRNPYTRFFSEYTFNRKPDELIVNEANKENFRDFIYQAIVYNSDFKKSCIDFPERVPDYPVRLENLYEDYSKIPFIVESEFYKSGKLKLETTKKVNVSNEDETLWKKFYTQEIADIIYYRMPRYFDLFGYDKNSWKK
jgi:hypothetical protein